MPLFSYNGGAEAALIAGRLLSGGEVPVMLFVDSCWLGHVSAALWQQAATKRE
jgi:hypothetical protein